MKSTMNPLYLVKVKKTNIGVIQKIFKITTEKMGIEFVYAYFEILLTDLLKKIKEYLTVQMIIDLVESYHNFFFKETKN